MFWIHYKQRNITKNVENECLYLQKGCADFEFEFKHDTCKLFICCDQSEIEFALSSSFHVLLSKLADVIMKKGLNCTKQLRFIFIYERNVIDEKSEA